MRNKNTGCKAVTLKLLALTSTALVGLALPLSAQAQDWTGANSADWFDGTNWNPAQVPAAPDNVTIEHTSGQAPRISGVGKDGVANKITVGDINTGSIAYFTIQGGGTLTSTSGVIGNLAGSYGSVDVGGPPSPFISKWTNSGPLVIGNAGAGGLFIGNGEVKNTDGTIGALAGSSGSVSLNGPTALWTNSGNLTVGDAGTGELTVLNGGTVSNVGGAIGSLAGSTGTVTIDGTGSTWTNGILRVGDVGTGTLNITNRGTVHDLVGAVAVSDPASNGHVTVDGAGSSWVNDGGTLIGVAGTGRLDIRNGGKVDTGLTVPGANAIVGSAAGSSGLAFVEDAGSTWNVVNDLVVGSYGSGSLVIDRGANVSVGGTLILADKAGATGSLDIGGGMEPGTLNAANVQFGAGVGRVLFNHTGTNYNFDAAISGLGTLNQWKGVTHLTADSSGFTGQTHITGGTLLVDGKLGTGAVDVQSGGTLGGKGSIGGTVTVNAGGILSGVQGQTLTMHNLTLDGGANVNVTLNSPMGAALFHVVNGLTLDGTLNITSGGAFGPGVYSLTTYGGALTNNGLDIGTTPFGSTAGDFGVQTSVVGQVNLISNVLPNLAFWDGDAAGNANNNLVDGGTGAWTAASTNWTDMNGSTNGVLHPQPTFAIFQGAAGTVTVDASAGPISVTGMQFATDGYQVTGDPITLADPNSIIRVGDGSAAGANYKATIGSVLTGSGGLNKTDYGTLILTADNTYTGGTTITDGTLQLGNGGTSGSIVGNVVNNGLLAFDRSDVTTFAGAISGNGAILKLGAGTINLTGDSNSFSGNVQVDGGALVVKTGGTLNADGLYIGSTAGSTGSFVVDGAGSTANSSGLLVGVAGNGTLTVSNGGKLTNGESGLGAIAGSKGVATVAGAGSSWTNSGDLYVGIGGTGTLTVSNGGTVSNKIGFIGQDVGSVGSVTVDGAGSKWTNSNAVVVGNAGTGALTISNGGVVNANAGVLVASRAGSTGTVNIGSAAGSAATAAGSLNALALQFGSGTGTLNFNHTDTNYTFATEIQGAGTIDQLAGNTNLTADSTGFTGAVNVKGGRLAVNGLLGGGPVTVSNGATLTGAGTIGSLTAQSGAIVAAGNGGVGTMTVAGNASFAAGSTFQVDLTSNGQSDLLKVGDMANVANGALLSVTKTNSAPYVLGAHYTVLSATGGLTGTFTFNNAQITNFMGLVGSSDANNYYLDVSKTKTFASAGLTPNQIATAGTLDGLPITSTLTTAIANLPSDASARYAFDQLSGEVHGSVKTVMIEDSRFLRSAVNDRLRAAFGSVGASGGNTVTYENGKPRAVDATTDGGAVWGQAFGSWGHWNSDGNAARANRSIGGFFMGADAPAFDTWRFGAVAGYSRTRFDAKDRHSSGTSDNYSVGLYGGTQWGDLAFRTGTAYTVSDIATSRRVNFAGFSDSLSGDYRADTAQAFGELGYKMQAGNIALEPFANLAYVSLRTDGFSEKGGVAALTSRSIVTDTTFTTLGLRASTSFDLNSMAVTAKGMVGWRHAFGDTIPNSVMSFAGSAPFSISGVPIARNAAVVDLGLDMNLRANTTLGVSYGGQFGSGVTDQTLRANLSVKF